MAKSNYLEDLLIGAVFRGSTFDEPANLFIALFTAAPGDANTGTEVSGGSYARAQSDPSTGNWAAPIAGNGQTSNLTQIDFPAPTGNWGTVTDMGIYDSLTGGNLLYHGPVTVPKQINGGDDAPNFPIGTLLVTEN